MADRHADELAAASEHDLSLAQQRVRVRNGRRDRRPERRKTTGTRAGHSSSQRPDPWWSAGPALASPCQGSAARAECRSVGPGSSAKARSGTQRASTDGCRAMSSPATTPSFDFRATMACYSEANEAWLRAAEPSRPHPPQEAAWQANAPSHRQGQPRQIEGSCPCRTCVRPAEGSHGAVIGSIAIKRGNGSARHQR
jgi:hypothetical protein